MPTGNSQQISQDAVFDILSNARRRYVLYYLRQAGEPVELGELANELAAWENDTTPDNLSKQQRKRVYVSLYQTHIPKLADAEMVEYDQERGTVTLTAGAHHLEGYLGDDEETTGGIRWQRSYALLAIGGGVLYALVALDAPVFGALSPLSVGLLVLLSLSALAAGHYVYSERKAADLPADALIRKRK
jgi:DNA-binding transcriptional ArsR family regulator